MAEQAVDYGAVAKQAGALRSVTPEQRARAIALINAALRRPQIDPLFGEAPLPKTSGSVEGDTTDADMQLALQIVRGDYPDATKRVERFVVSPRQSAEGTVGEILGKSIHVGPTTPYASPYSDIYKTPDGTPPSVLDALDMLRHEMAHRMGADDSRLPEWGKPISAYDVSDASHTLHQDIELPSDTKRSDTNGSKHMAAQPTGSSIDYAALAKQAGAFKSRPPPAEPQQPAGLLERGNIDLTNRPRVQNPDGTTSTVRSISINDNGREILIPTISDEGHVLSDADATALYRTTGKHLGIFDTPANATKYAEQLHTDQANAIARQAGSVDYTSLAQEAGAVSSQSAATAAEPNSVGTIASHLWQQINPIAAAQTLSAAVLHPVNAVKSIGAAQGALYDKAKASYEQGDYLTAARHFVDYLLPLVGPSLDKSSDLFQAKHWAAGGGDALGIGLALFGPKAIAQARVHTGAILSNPNAAEAEAVKAGQAAGVPVDLATASGNKFIRGTQKLADESLGGSVVAQKAEQATQAAMGTYGEKLADTARATAVTPEQAGQGIRDALASKIQAHTDLANHAYDTLRQIESQPSHARTVTTPVKGTTAIGGSPVTVSQPTTMALPVDLRSAKAALQPIYDQLARQMPVTQKQASAGFTALENVVHGPDYAPLSQVDRDLSAIKSIARDRGGVAKLAVARLDAAVRATAATAGKDAALTLRQGRQATAAKYATQDLVDALPGGKLDEPVAVFRAATAPKDAGIEFLRAVTEHAPQTLPQIARAKLEDLMGMGPQKSYAEWSKLGPETKKLLFPQNSQALDRFFLLARRLAENPNPSGSALTLWKGGELTALATNPLYGVPYSLGMTTLSAMLHSPTVTRALTRTLSISLSQAAPAAQAAALADLVKAAQDAEIPLATLPKAADRSPSGQKP